MRSLAPFAERRPRMLRTLETREFSLYLLHQQQIRLLSEWREAMQGDDEEKTAALAEFSSVFGQCDCQWLKNDGLRSGLCRV